ncbi:Nucleoporin nup49/NSP49 (Nuclear pore protein nup49/NSP49) [Dimargaris xerosporica]|nr:Nucleoporin nup49/NSP49 (Nuclear pore protein nup49/NSP49) [Dimargaris xerosporica]
MFGQAGTSTFGSPAPATGGSLFGNAGAASTPASSGAGASSLFGAAASTNTLNFGAPTSTATSAAAPAFGSAAPSTSLFGSTGKPATTPSLFASSTAGTNSAGFGAANPSTSTAPSSFGAASATTSAPAFGASSTLSGFGTTAPAKTTASAFGAANPLATTAAATTASALAPANLTKQTRVADLPQASRSILEEFERYQQTQLHIGEQLAMRDTPSQIEQAAQRLQDLDQQRSGLTFALAADAQRLDDLKQKVNTELRSLEAAARILGDQRLGTTAHLAHASALVSTPAASLPFAYYWELISAFDAKYQEYDKLASQIETHLATLRRHHVNGKDEYSAVGEHQPATTLNNAMRYMHDSFMALLSQVSAVHSQVNDLARAMD